MEKQAFLDLLQSSVGHVSCMTMQFCLKKTSENSDTSSVKDRHCLAKIVRSTSNRAFKDVFLSTSKRWRSELRGGGGGGGGAECAAMT